MPSTTIVGAKASAISAIGMILARQLRRAPSVPSAPKRASDQMAASLLRRSPS